MTPWDPSIPKSQTFAHARPSGHPRDQTRPYGLLRSLWPPATHILRHPQVKGVAQGSAQMTLS